MNSSDPAMLNALKEALQECRRLTAEAAARNRVVIDAVAVANRINILMATLSEEERKTMWPEVAKVRAECLALLDEPPMPRKKRMRKAKL